MTTASRFPTAIHRGTHCAEVRGGRVSALHPIAQDHAPSAIRERDG